MPESWDEDRDRCREAGIPDDVVYRPKWRIAIDQIEQTIGNGVRFAWQTFDWDFAHHLHEEVPASLVNLLLPKTGWSSAIVLLGQWRDSAFKAFSYD